MDRMSQLLRSSVFLSARKRPSVMILGTVVTGALGAGSYYAYRLVTGTPKVGLKDKQVGLSDIEWPDNQPFKIQRQNVEYPLMSPLQGTTTVVRIGSNREERT